MGIKIEFNPDLALRDILKYKNGYFSKIKRTLASVLPVAENRTGKCRNCGECCKLPKACRFLKYRDDGTSFCSIYKIRPLNCRKYPRTESECLTKETCGFNFQKKNCDTE